MARIGNRIKYKQEHFNITKEGSAILVCHPNFYNDIVKYTGLGDKTRTPYNSSNTSRNESKNC